ncbi:MAG: hypothetical protein OXC40_03895, partial [Proteobacteria bacterium]|nr:hypothetical protein [Pseudomonadota bacterium]
SKTTMELAQIISADFGCDHVAVVAPISENKKGLFRREIYYAREENCQAVAINNQIYSLDQVLPGFHPQKKYTVKVIADIVELGHSQSLNQLELAIAKAITVGFEHCEVYRIKPGDVTLGNNGRHYSSLGGCPECGFSWPAIDSRYFAQNSLGRCPDCDGFGASIDQQENLGIDSHLFHHDQILCTTCDGTGLNPDFDHITIAGHSLRSMYLCQIDELAEFTSRLLTLLPEHRDNKALATVQRELTKELGKMKELGLGHLSLGRRIASLSNGERQRLRLSGILIEPLSGVLYILDEPSQGLHPADLEQIWPNIITLRDLGNTIIIIDHDEYCWQRADRIIELGPGGGRSGGELVASFPPGNASQFRHLSKTAEILADQHRLTFSRVVEKQAKKDSSLGSKKAYLTWSNICYHHLKIDQLSIQKHAINVVSGVSGVGKTSLAMGVLSKNLHLWMASLSRNQARGTFDPEDFQPVYCDKITGLDPDLRVTTVHRQPMAKSSVSMPATYLNCMGELRTLYASLPAAQLAGLTKKHFSLMQPYGRCSTCDGKGYLVHSMKFLAEVRETCPDCQGKRFHDYVLAVTYKGYSLSDVLNLTIEEVADLFKNYRKIAKKLECAVDLGLGYLTFGQPSSTLSGGEAQRLKLSTYLGKKNHVQDILFIDEPTRGLHDDDVQYLIKSLKKIVALGTTLVIVEHNAQVIAHCDHLIDLGYGPGSQGGQLAFSGDISSFHQYYQNHQTRMKNKSHPSYPLSATAKHLFAT